ncbi:MAG: DUF1499 domain-containing protein [Pseudomonadota bacterium]|nr:DUF1499 domain-containing protein [Pseudomonadota bacterium]
MEAKALAKGGKACKWSIRLTFIGLSIFLISFLGPSLGLSPMIAMLGITLTVLLCAIGAIVSIIGMIRSKGTSGGSSIPLTWLSMAIGISAIILTAININNSGGPSIHDISTDLDNPPIFIEVAKLRTDSDNPVEYSGEKTANLQRSAYPDIKTIVLSESINSVYDEALDVATKMGWEIVASNKNLYRIEATASTPFVGFKDDVVIRMKNENNKTFVDIRSKSRLGSGDMGVNAKRIRTFREKLLEVL